jgi:hypothetical protein
MFSEMPGMFPRTRALYRVLNMKQHGLLTDRHWAGLMALQPHVDKHLLTANREGIIGAAATAKSRIQTDLGITEVLNLICTVYVYTVFHFTTFLT